MTSKQTKELAHLGVVSAAALGGGFFLGIMGSSLAEFSSGVFHSQILAAGVAFGLLLCVFLQYRVYQKEIKPKSGETMPRGLKLFWALIWVPFMVIGAVLIIWNYVILGLQ
jgi:hypothetical protein